MEIRLYLTTDGKAPFAEWLYKLRDRKARARIRVQLDRITLGNPGDYKSLGAGLFELRIHYGPGYRIYFGLKRGHLVLLLCGGDKSSQPADVKLAKEYWQDYRSRKDGKE
jgi:putative addiction module killer protein